MRTLVKVCGLTRPEDVRLAASAGVDVLGLVFVPSPRWVTTADAIKLTRAASDAGFTGKLAGVFADAPIDQVIATTRLCRLAVVQLHGNESPEYSAQVAAEAEVWKVVKVRPGWTTSEISMAANIYPSTMLLLDAFVHGVPGATGQSFDHAVAVPLARQRPVILAGGLKPETIKAAIAMVRPYAVDVCSGVETIPGIKDERRIRDLMAAVAEAS